MEAERLQALMEHSQALVAICHAELARNETAAVRKGYEEVLAGLEAELNELAPSDEALLPGEREAVCALEIELQQRKTKADDARTRLGAAQDTFEQARADLARCEKEAEASTDLAEETEIEFRKKSEAVTNHQSCIDDGKRLAAENAAHPANAPPPLHPMDNEATMRVYKSATRAIRAEIIRAATAGPSAMPQ